MPPLNEREERMRSRKSDGLRGRQTRTASPTVRNERDHGLEGTNTVALTQQTMTDEQRKSVALEYLKAFDHDGVTSSGGSILDLFADDAQVYFPKWGLAYGTEE